MNSLKTFLLLFFVSNILTTVVDAQGTKNQPFPLTVASDLGCETIIADHTFEGNCCSLAGPAPPLTGCELKVVNGRCRVRGDVWQLDFTSTYEFETCPQSEYVVTSAPTVGPTATPTASSTVSNPTDDSAAYSVTTTTFSAMVVAMLMGFILV